MFTLRACLGLMLSVVLLAILQGTAHAQNYHYSNGWHPGKRSKPLVASLFRASVGMSSDDACSFRPQVLMAINSIVQEELSRIQQTCIPESPFLALKGALERMRATSDNSGDKADEPSSSSKW